MDQWNSVIDYYFMNKNQLKYAKIDPTICNIKNYLRKKNLWRNPLIGREWGQTLLTSNLNTKHYSFIRSFHFHNNNTGHLDEIQIYKVGTLNQHFK